MGDNRGSAIDRTRPVILLAGLALLAGCAPAPPSAQSADGQFIVRLRASPRNAGEIGQASFVPQGNATNVVIFASGLAQPVSRPIHLYTYIYEGTCQSHGPKAAFALNDVVVPTYGPGLVGLTLNKTVPVPFATLRAGTYAIALRTQAPDFDEEVFCGDIL